MALIDSKDVAGIGWLGLSHGPQAVGVVFLYAESRKGFPQSHRLVKSKTVAVVQQLSRPPHILHTNYLGQDFLKMRLSPLSKFRPGSLGQRLPTVSARSKVLPVWSARRYATLEPNSAITSENGIPIDFTFSPQERESLKSALSKVRENPYTSYKEFEQHIEHIATTGAVAGRFREVCEKKRDGDVFEDPYVLLKNCPIDDALPELSFQTPVDDKRKYKTTYVSEGFLLLYAKMMQQEPIGYINVNDGDVFQDIHPMQTMSATQSQKALQTIYFHKDLANHFVRPDWVNILGLRASPKNEILTSFVKTKHLLESLPEKTKEVLRENRFHTPFDDLTTSSSNKKLGKAPIHRILGGATDYDIRFFENRTVGLDREAKRAVAEVLETLHRLKQPLMILKGDFIGSANNECVHNKEVIHIGDPVAQKNRWLMKTVNVKRLEDHAQHMVEGQERIING